ncbi:MAG: hypothetical protein FJX77_13370 [Armatimonadetes bacterium]|nr:hypothetical protein [Armatimonadota bacterium]
MDFWLNVAMRWLHVGAAVVGIGATFVLRCVLIPALAGRPEGDELLGRVRSVLKRWIHGAIGVLLLTGFYNYLVVASPRAAEAGEKLKPYHPIMGTKILLSLALFGIAILLLVPVPSFHARRKMWLTVNLVLAGLILFLGAFLRRLW